jgi:hypothetical protein
MRPALLASALALAGCNGEAQQEVSPAPKGGVPMTIDPNYRMALDPDLASGRIPPQFHGVWDTATGNCDPVSPSRIRITDRRIEYHNMIGEVSGIGGTSSEVIADLVMGTGGQIWVQPTRLSREISSEGERLRMSDARNAQSPGDVVRKRCSG